MKITTESCVKVLQELGNKHQEAVLFDVAHFLQELELRCDVLEWRIADYRKYVNSFESYCDESEKN